MDKGLAWTADAFTINDAGTVAGKQNGPKGICAEIGRPASPELADVRIVNATVPCVGGIIQHAVA
jgi:hypothetical protein